MKKCTRVNMAEIGQSSDHFNCLKIHSAAEIFYALKTSILTLQITTLRYSQRGAAFEKFSIKFVKFSSFAQTLETPQIQSKIIFTYWKESRPLLCSVNSWSTGLYIACCLKAIGAVDWEKFRSKITRFYAPMRLGICSASVKSEICQKSKKR